MACSIFLFPLSRALGFIIVFSYIEEEKRGKDTNVIFGILIRNVRRNKMKLGLAKDEVRLVPYSKEWTESTTQNGFCQ
jgi:hypothetical protein